MSINSKISISKNRYYLHRMVRKNCPDVRLVVIKKTIYVKHYFFIPALSHPYVKRLLDMGYCMQTEI
jgi:hypothetical protein